MLKKINSIITQISKTISSSSRGYKIAIGIICLEIVAIVILLVTGSNPHLNVDKNQLPLATQTFLDVGEIDYVLGKEHAVILDSLVCKREDEYIVEDFVSCSISKASNPTFVNEHYLNPVLLLTADLDVPNYVYDICKEPVKIVDKVQLASGEIYDIEYWTYVIDYSVISPEYPTVILPVSTCVLWLTEQQRLVFNFTAKSSYTYSDMLLAVETPNNTEYLYDMQSVLNLEYENLLKEVNVFFAHWWNFDAFINARE